MQPSTKPIMMVSLDDGETWVKTTGVRVTYDSIIIPGEDADGELHVNLTPEGVVFDVWVDNENPGTSSETADQIVYRLLEENE